MVNDHSAKRELNKLNKELPLLSQIVDYMAFGNEEKRREEWPADILLPKHAWRGICTYVHNISTDEYLRNSVQMNNKTERIRFLATWAKTQGIYRFDPDIYADLISAPLTGELPSELLKNMPEWCIYLETPTLNLMAGKACRGCWVMLDYDAGPDGANSRYELNVMFDLVLPEGVDFPFATVATIPLGDKSLQEVMDEYKKSGLGALGQPNDRAFSKVQSAFAIDAMDINAVVDDLSEILSQVLSLVLYICTQNDYGDVEGGQPSRPNPQRTKKGIRLFAPATPKLWDVGVRLGSAVRRAKREAHAADSGGQERAGVRPHIRTHHWQGFRIGKMKDEDGNHIPSHKRGLIVRFIPSIPVAMPEGMLRDDLPSVIRRVN